MERGEGKERWSDGEKDGRENGTKDEGWSMDNGSIFVLAIRQMPAAMGKGEGVWREQRAFDFFMSEDGNAPQAKAIVDMTSARFDPSRPVKNP
jgi:hypothetical protein